MNKVVKIEERQIGPGNRPYIIAEMACAHDGSFKKAQHIIEAAAEANADCIQLQFFEADETVTPQHEAYPVIKEIEFETVQWKALLQLGKKRGLDVFACTYDVPSVKLAEKLGVDGIKLNSADLSNPEVLIAVAKSGIPFTLGTGASTMDEIREGLALLSEHGARDVVLMHGVQNFPTATEDLNIAKLKLLKETFDLPVGYADHTDGDDPFGKIVDLVAVGLGANVLEKHITYDRAEKGIDYQAALEPTEFKLYVENIKRAWQAHGSGQIKSFTPSDLKYRKFQKKSVVAIKDLNENHVVSRADVAFIRNVEPGMPPSQFNQLEGRRTKRKIAKFENILPGALQ